MDDDLAFLELIQQGDESGLAELMARHKLAVFRFIIRYVGNEADAGELTEETFYRVYVNASRFRPKARVRTWIFAIAANLSRDFLRRRSRRQRPVSLEAPSGKDDGISVADVVPDKRPGPDDLSVSSESIEEIEAAIHRLPDKLKLPFIYCVLEDHSHDDCAALLGVNRKTVETRIYRARQQLRNQLADFHNRG